VALFLLCSSLVQSCSFVLFLFQTGRTPSGGDPRFGVVQRGWERGHLRERARPVNTVIRSQRPPVRRVELPYQDSPIGEQQSGADVKLGRYCIPARLGGSAETRFWGFYHGFGVFFDGSGCFFGLGASGDSPKAGSTQCEKSVKELEETCRLSPEDASDSEYLR
jgi:hypothetical protein